MMVSGKCCALPQSALCASAGCLKVFSPLPRWDKPADTHGGIGSNRTTDVLEHEPDADAQAAILIESQRRLNLRLYANPRSIRGLKLVLHDADLRLRTVGLSFRLTKSLICKYSESYGADAAA